MASPEQFSEHNCANSVAAYVATELLDRNYLIYWHELDAVETPDGLYTNYSTTEATYLANATFAARYNAAVALVTLRGPLTAANPVFVTRPSNSGVVADTQSEVVVPGFAIEVGPPVVLDRYELGTTVKWRARHLLLYGFARSEPEQGRFADVLSVLFDDAVVLNVFDHDAGSLALIGPLTVLSPSMNTDILPLGPAANTYAVELNARLEYIA